jgi:threonine dehydratase
LNATLGAGSLAILLDHGVEVVTVGEDEIVAAMRLLWERAKQVVEASGAVPLAGVLALRRAGVDLGADVGVVLSGGNVDLDDLPFGTGQEAGS